MAHLLRRMGGSHGRPQQKPSSFSYMRQTRQSLNLCPSTNGYFIRYLKLRNKILILKILYVFLRLKFCCAPWSQPKYPISGRTLYINFLTFSLRCYRGWKGSNPKYGRFAKTRLLQQNKVFAHLNGDDHQSMTTARPPGIANIYHALFGLQKTGRGFFAPML